MQDSLKKEFSVSHRDILNMPYDRFYIMVQNLNDLIKEENKKQGTTQSQQKNSRLPSYNNLINKYSSGSGLSLPKTNIPKF